MAGDDRIDVAEWRHMLRVLADRFESEVYRIVGCVVVAAAEVEATATRLSGDRQPVPDANRVQVSAALHAVAASAEALSRSVDEIVREMISAFRLARSGETGTVPRCSGNVDELVQAVLLTREIGAMVTEIAGLTNLLAMNLTIETTQSDQLAAADKAGALADRATRATEEIAWQIAEIRQCVTRATAAITAETSECDIATSGSVRRVCAA